MLLLVLLHTAYCILHTSIFIDEKDFLTSLLLELLGILHHLVRLAIAAGSEYEYEREQNGTMRCNNIHQHCVIHQPKQSVNGIRALSKWFHRFPATLTAAEFCSVMQSLPYLTDNARTDGKTRSSGPTLIFERHR